jgi:hypothetical protein
MSTHEEVLQADEARRAALLANDVHALGLCLAPEYVMVHSSARVESRTSMFETLRAGGLVYESIDVSESMVDALSTDIALQTSVVRQKVLVRGAAIELHVRAISIWVRRQGNWLLRFYQTTPVLPPAGR